MPHHDYLIIGAGLSGATFAHEMTKAGAKCLVIEQRGHVGGNVYTENIRGIHVHRHGAHIFHTAERKIWDYVNQFADFSPYINAPLANYQGELYNLPFNMNTFYQLWGVKTPAEAQAAIEAQIAGAGSAEPTNLEEQALKLVGRDIYEKLIKGYTEKQWGRPCKELPAFIIRRLPLRFTYDNNYFNDPYQGIPKGGYTQMIERMLAGVDVRTGLSYREYLADQPGANHKKVFYTGMIDAFYDYSLGRLEYRSLRFMDEDMPDCENYQGNAVINYTDKKTPYTRVIEHRHFDPESPPEAGTIITREYPEDWHTGREPYYPINDDENNALYQKYRELASSRPDVIFAGRLSLYRYMDMDVAIMEALRLANTECTHG